MIASVWINQLNSNLYASLTLLILIFRVKRSKAKVTVEDCLCLRFQMLTLAIRTRKMPINLDSKGLRLRSQVRIVYIFVSMLNLKTANSFNQ